MLVSPVLVCGHRWNDWDQCQWLATPSDPHVIESDLFVVAVVVVVEAADVLYPCLRRGIQRK